MTVNHKSLDPGLLREIAVEIMLDRARDVDRLAVEMRTMDDARLNDAGRGLAYEKIAELIATADVTVSWTATPPPETDTHTEWGVRYHFPNGGVRDVQHNSEARAFFGAELTASDVTAEVLRREVTDWQPVPPPPTPLAVQTDRSIL